MDAAFTAFHRGGTGSPLVLVHGFTDTWRTWDLVLAELERDHDVLAPTLPCHAGAPSLDEPTLAAFADAVEDAMDHAGFATADIVGNSLGGYLALELAARGRARSALALAPAGGWPNDDPLGHQLHDFFLELHASSVRAAPRAEQIMSTPEGRRKATQFVTVAYEHIPADLLVHQLVGTAECDVPRILEFAIDPGWHLDASRISCPVRIVWCRNDLVLPWPLAATRYQNEWATDAEWVFMDECGHLPQLDRPADTARHVREWIATITDRAGRSTAR